jgi:hypothetical protein
VTLVSVAWGAHEERTESNRSRCQWRSNASSNETDPSAGAALLDVALVSEMTNDSFNALRTAATGAQ